MKRNGERGDETYLVRIGDQGRGCERVDKGKKIR